MSKHHSAISKHKQVVAASPAASAQGARTAPAAKRGNGAAAARVSPAQPDNTARCAMIAEAAYYRAERRGFASGSELDDWLEAEREIGQQLNS